jgi:hypothetical protein
MGRILAVVEGKVMGVDRWSFVIRRIADCQLPIEG